MVAEVDIANLALGRIGHSQVLTSIQESSSASLASRSCARLYPIVLDRLLHRGGWPWAERIEPLTPSGTDVIGWGYTYDRPDNCLHVVAVCDAAGAREWSQPVRIDSPRWTRLPRPPFRLFDADDNTVICTDVPEAYGVMRWRVENPARFPPLFVNAFADELSAELAPVLKVDAKFTQLALQRAVGSLSEAQAEDLNEAVDDDEFDSASIRARG